MIDVDPKHIIPITATGIGDMGDASDLESSPRFSLDMSPEGVIVDRFVVVYIRMLFVGGTGFNDLTLRIAHRNRNNLFNFESFIIQGVGTTGEPVINFTVAGDELKDHTYIRDPATRIIDEGVPEWVNPDPGNMRWSQEWGLVDAANLKIS